MDSEKNPDTSLQQVSTNHSTLSQEHEKGLEKVETHETLARVDIHNSQAFKGDDSDGKIKWTVRKWFAAGFLAMLYTGAKAQLCLNVR